MQAFDCERFAAGHPGGEFGNITAGVRFRRAARPNIAVIR
jgi:hypothetical protein